MAKAEEERVHRIEGLVREVEAIPDPRSREVAHSLMEAILELHGAGLDRIMDILFESGEPGKAAIRHLAADSLVASLLVLHGLHPDDVETRVQHILSKIHANAELMGVFEGVVRVRLNGTACGLKESVITSILQSVPDVSEVLVEESSPLNDFVPLTSLGMAI